MLEKYGKLVVAPADDEETLVKMAGSATGIVARGNSLITDAVIQAASQLKVIGRSGSGFDSVDIGSATARRIPVVFAPNGPSRAVAEGVLAMMLNVGKQLPELTAAVREDRWGARLTTDVRDLEQSVLGIIGLGRIGRRVAELARAFDMTVIAYDPYLPAGALPEGVSAVTLDELAKMSDYITVHVPLSDETHHIIDAKFLAGCKQDAIVINVGRGPLIDLEALADALYRNALFGAGLDVFEPEPPPSGHRILAHPRVVLSPHGIALSRLAKRRIFEDVASGMVSVFRGERPQWVVNPQVFD